MFAPQISVCLRAPLLCRIIVFAIGPALISWHYRPRFDDAAVLLAVDRGGRECRSLPAASSRPRWQHPRPDDFSSGSRWSTREYEISSDEWHAGPFRKRFPGFLGMAPAIPLTGKVLYRLKRYVSLVFLSCCLKLS